MASPDGPSSPSPSLFPLIFTFSFPARSLIINPFPGDDILDTNPGQPPASRESIGAMESVVIGEDGGIGDRCVACLEEWGAGDMVRAMPCGHRFHGDCIERWLGVHGLCPVCLYEMPPEEEEDAGKREEEECRGRGVRVWVFSIDFQGTLGGVGGEIDSGESGEAAYSSADTATGQE